MGKGEEERSRRVGWERSEELPGYKTGLMIGEGI